MKLVEYDIYTKKNYFEEYTNGIPTHIGSINEQEIPVLISNMIDWMKSSKNKVIFRIYK